VIFDDNGVIDSGTEADMRSQFERYMNRVDEVPNPTGDVRLAQIHGRFA